jgi:hypothetical protein
MTHELKRVLLDESYPNDGLIELAPDQWFDPHASGLQAARPRDRLRQPQAPDAPRPRRSSRRASASSRWA